MQALGFADKSIGHHAEAPTERELSATDETVHQMIDAVRENYMT
jgi:hypothetical protein